MIAIEATQHAAAGGASTVTTPSITPAGTNRLLIGCGGNDDGSPASVSSFTYGGVGMTSRFNSVLESFFRLVGYSTTAPSTSGGTVSYTISTSNYAVCVTAIALSGVDQTTPLGTPVSGSTTGGTSVSVNVSSETDDLVLDFIFGNATTIAVNNGNTSRIEVENFISLGDSYGVSTKAGDTTVTIGWARTDTSFGIGMFAVNINNDGSGGGPTGHPAMRRLGGIKHASRIIGPSGVNMWGMLLGLFTTIGMNAQMKGENRHG